MKNTFLLSAFCLVLPFNSSFAAGTKKGDADKALQLYNQQAYADSASAFDQVLSGPKINRTLCYYAALANWQCRRTARANQLFNYLISDFPGSQEAIYAQKMLSSQSKAKSTQQSASEDGDLPQAVKDALPSNIRALLNTSEGRAAAQQVMREQPKNLEIIRTGLVNKNPIRAPKPPIDRANAKDGHPFSAADIAKDGAGGIDQSRYPNCWFEASMSALAQLPRGQRLLADTIRYGNNSGYIVRFKNDGVEYKISEDDIASSGIHDKALWASILECAEVKKFPNNAGANGEDNNQSRLEIGLGCITGCRAETINPASTDVQELSAFIGSAIKSQNPIVAATYNPFQLATLPPLVVSNHAYTVIDFDPSKQMVTIRNPHGSNSRPFALPNDPQHLHFEQSSDGVFKMSLPLIQKYFHSLARSFI